MLRKLHTVLVWLFEEFHLLRPETMYIDSYFASLHFSTDNR